MPLYEYECEGCHRRFEVIQKFSDPPVARCEVCGAAVRKLLSSPAIQFKGSGWYITDYARKSSGDSSRKPAGESQSDGASDPKPATDSSSTPASSSKPGDAGSTKTPSGSS
jgi:putative FmdB family regulatory protein